MGPDAAGFSDWIHEAFASAPSQSGRERAKESNHEYFERFERSAAGSSEGPRGQRTQAGSQGRQRRRQQFFGTAGGPLLLGWLYDNAGGFQTSYLAAAAFSLAGAAVLASGVAAAASRSWRRAWRNW